jgi:hypothetical protein
VKKSQQGRKDYEEKSNGFQNLNAPSGLALVYYALITNTKQQGAKKEWVFAVLCG